MIKYEKNSNNDVERLVSSIITMEDTFFIKYILCHYAAAHSLYHKILLQHTQMRMHSARTSVASY